MALLLKLSLLPLFIGDSSHDFLVCGCFFLFVSDFSLFLVSEPLLNVLVSLLEKALLKPVLEYFIGGLLFNLLFESLVFSFPVPFNTLLLILLSLSLFPFRHTHLFLLLDHLLFGLTSSHLLENVSLGLFDKLFLKLDLMLLLAHPLLMSHRIGRAIANLTSLHGGGVAWCT